MAIVASLLSFLQTVGCPSGSSDYTPKTTTRSHPSDSSTASFIVCSDLPIYIYILLQHILLLTMPLHVSVILLFTQPPFFLGLLHFIIWKAMAADKRKEVLLAFGIFVAFLDRCSRILLDPSVTKVLLQGSRRQRSRMLFNSETVAVASSPLRAACKLGLQSSIASLDNLGRLAESSCSPGASA